MKLALAGKFVTRVIYLEDPHNAAPVREIDHSQNWFEVAVGQDPLAAADKLGRPVAILRLGGRVPDAGPDAGFFFGSPPYVPCPPTPAAAPAKAPPRAEVVPPGNKLPPAVPPAAPPAPAAPLPSASAPARRSPGTTAAMNHASQPWPSLWRLAIIAMGVLILCSCKAAAPTPPADLSGIKSDGYATLPPEAMSGEAAMAAPAAPVGPPGMELGVPMPYTPTGPWSPPGISKPWPKDEYLRDGGHLGSPLVTGRQGEIRGLEMEDTAAQFQTADGRNRHRAQQLGLPLQPAIRRRPPGSQSPGPDTDRAFGRRA